MIIIHLITWVGLFIWYYRMRKKEKKGLYRKIFLFAVTGNLAGTLVSSAYEFQGRSITEPVLKRGALGGQPEKETWIAATEDGDRYQIEVTVPAVAYSQSETEEWIAVTVRQLDAAVFDGTSAASVREKLDLPTSLPDNPVQITWSSNHPEWVDSHGTLSGEIPQEGAEIILHAQLSLQEVQEDIERRIHVCPPEKSEEEKMLETIQEKIRQLNEDKSSPDYLLPGNAGGKTLFWEKENPQTGIMILGFTLLIALLLGAKEFQDEAEQRKRRENSLIRDYPELLSEMVLLMGAGLSMRRIFERIGRDYHRKRENGFWKERREGYEEIYAAWLEMEQGMTEINAYEHLGERCGIRQYRTLAAILSQNLRKGNKGLLELMKKEAMDAQEERRRNAKIAGETAGTRLLLPMGMMLVVVLIILVVPALLSFGA